jgi:outer membrane murein-binding lipoprotein Lpp
MMKRAGKLLTVLVVGVLGVWGCANGPANPNGQADKIQKLEGKCADLEKDYRVAASARDEARKKATSLEEESKRLQKQLDEQKAQLQKEQEAEMLIAKERDELRQQIEARTGERDLLQGRCDRLKKGLQNLLGQDDAAMASPSPSVSNAPVLGN